MNLQSLIGPAGDRPLQAGLVGVGEFGRSFLSQAMRVPGLEARAACDRDVERAAAAFASLGVTEARICDTAVSARRTFESGGAVVVPDAELLLALPLDAVVEATGHPEAAAAVAEAALGSGMHVVMVTKEAECVVGPVLAEKARRAGLVHTPVDGDQPSLLIGLIAWARLLGMEIVAAGKASEYDFVWDPAREELTSQGRTVAVPGLSDLWAGEPARAGATARGRGQMLSAFRHRTVPDLCEMGIVCNATGLGFDRPELHAPIARTVELPDIFGPADGGGMLGGAGDGAGIVDIFNCLRRPDELSFAGGVFVIASTPDRLTARLFREKGIPVSADDRRVLLHNPVHLLGAEAPMSVLSACRARQSTAGDAVRPHVDLTAIADREITAGTEFRIGHRHEIEGASSVLTPAAPLSPEAPLPYYLLPGAVARMAIPAGTPVTGGMVDLPPGGTLQRLRREQDELFFRR